MVSRHEVWLSIFIFLWTNIYISVVIILLFGMDTVLFPSEPVLPRLHLFNVPFNNFAITM